MFEIEKVDMEHIDRIRPLWEKLIQANAANSPYFADYYGTFEFEIRKGFLQEKLDNGAAMYTAVLVDREKKQDAGFVTVTYNRDTSFGEIEMLYLLEEYRGRGVRGVMHSFCGTREHYRRILGCGDFLFGVGGVVTFKRSAIAGLLPEIGIERAVLETDAPYLTPVPFRGKRNESAYVRYVCAKVAELCGTDERRVEEATERNVRAMFGDSIFC